MSEPAVHLNFTATCRTCGGTVQYANGFREPHPCPENPAVTIEGCNATTGLVERVEGALDDYELLTEGEST